MLKHAKVSTAGASSDPAKVGGDDWNADHEVDANGVTMTAGSAAPAAPAAGKMTLYARMIAGRPLPGAIGPSGLASALQPLFARNKIAMLSYAGNSAVTGGQTVFGMSAPSSLGTMTARNVATTNLFTSMKRGGWVSSSTAGNRASIYWPAQYHRGAGPQMGGFFAVFRWGCSDAAPVAGARTLVGMAPGSTAITAEPTTSTNCVFVGTGSSDTNLALYHNDGSGSATKIDLGANFPDHTLSEDMYELALFCAPNSDRIEWEVTRLNTGHVASGVITTDLPVNTTLLVPSFNRTNGATALAVGIDVVGMYIETDY